MLQCVLYTPVIQYAFSTLFLLGLVIYLGRFAGRSATIGWFRMFLILSIVYNLSAAGIKCPPDQATFAWLVDIYGMTGAIISPVLIIFVLYFTNREHFLGRPWVRLLFMAVPLYLLYISWTDELVVSHDLGQTVMAFGYHNLVLGPHSGLVGSIELLGYIIPIIMLVSYLRRIEDPFKKREVRLVTLGLVISVVPAIVVEGFIQSALHVTVFPIGPVTAVIAYSIITYALTKYGLRILSLGSITSDLMQVMPGGLVVLDYTNTIRYVNKGAADMLGYPEGELPGLSIKKLFPSTKSYEKFHTSILGQASPGQQIAGQETQLATHDGQRLFVSLNTVSVYAGRVLTNHLVSFTDITPLKQAEADLEAEKASVERKVVERTQELATAQAQLSASIKSLPLGFIMVNSAGRVTTINPAVRKILDLGGSHLTVANLTDRLGGYDLADLIDRCLIKRHSGEVKDLAIGGRFLHLFAAPIIGDEHQVLGAVMLVEDVTEQKVLERSKDEFFSIASHELRTPLTSIRGNSSMMINYYKEALKNPDLQEMIHDVHESSIRLIGIVNDFLDVSRLEQSKMVFKLAEAEVLPLVHSVENEIKAVADEKHTKLILGPELAKLPHAITDTDRFKQIIFNLVGNALKFTEHGRVTVSGEVKAGMITLHVADTGRGIPAAAQNLLFRKFQQGGASLLTRDTVKGTGLGLYISRLMVEGMGGKIWLDHSEEGKGTTFAFTLPVATPARLAELAKNQAAQASATDSTTGLTSPSTAAKRK